MPPVRKIFGYRISVNDVLAPCKREYVEVFLLFEAM